MRVYQVATVAIALIGGIGLYLNFRTASEVSATLAQVRSGFSAYEDALVTYEDYKWAFDPESGTEPPTIPKGILVEYQNRSNVPIQVLQSELRVFFGEIEVSPPLVKVDGEGPIILSPGELSGSSVIHSDDFRKFLPMMSSEPGKVPNLHCLLTVQYSRLNSTVVMEYSVKVTIPVELKYRKTKLWIKGPETVRLLEDVPRL